MPPLSTATDEPPAPAPARDPERPPIARVAVVLIAVIGAALVVAGVVAGSRDRSVDRWAGTVLSTPQPKPDLVLTDTSGRPFDLRAETKGQTVVLMFGYTSCPDVCPINLASFAAAADNLDRSLGRSLRLVFVTVDPARDTPDVIRRFLDQFDRRFVGLTGTPEQLRAAQQAAGVPAASDDLTARDGVVGHATQMIVYQPDGLARIVYPFPTRQADWRRDLPRLLAGETPS